jgi:hypothetical protein
LELVLAGAKGIVNWACHDHQKTAVTYRHVPSSDRTHLDIVASLITLVVIIDVMNIPLNFLPFIPHIGIRTRRLLDFPASGPDFEFLIISSFSIILVIFVTFPTIYGKGGGCNVRFRPFSSNRFVAHNRQEILGMIFVGRR